MPAACASSTALQDGTTQLSQPAALAVVCGCCAAQADVLLMPACRLPLQAEHCAGRRRHRRGEQGQDCGAGLARRGGLACLGCIRVQLLLAVLLPCYLVVGVCLLMVLRGAKRRLAGCSLPAEYLLAIAGTAPRPLPAAHGSGPRLLRPPGPPPDHPHHWPQQHLRALWHRGGQPAHDCCRGGQPCRQPQQVQRAGALQSCISVPCLLFPSHVSTQ